MTENINTGRLPTLDAAEVVDRARHAVGKLRDAVREGRRIDFRQRDPLVLAIHAALDLPRRSRPTEREEV